MDLLRKIGRGLLVLALIICALAIVVLILQHWDKISAFLVRLGPVGVLLAAVGAAAAGLIGLAPRKDDAARKAKIQADIEAKGKAAYDETKSKLDALPAGDVVDSLPNSGAVHDVIDAGTDRILDRSREVVSGLSSAGRAAPVDHDRPGGDEADRGGSGEDGGDSAAG